MNDLTYDGAFRITKNTFGPSSINYAQGPIEYNPDNHSLFIVGHPYQQAIAEFPIPPLVQSANLSDLNMSSTPIQIYAEVLDRAPTGNPEGLDRIGGLHYIPTTPTPTLIVNAYEYYDAPANNTLSTLIIRNSNDIANSAIDGYFGFVGPAGHTSGWISPVPTSLQSALGGTHITGFSSGIPIIGRASVGPSAFSFQQTDLLQATTANEIPTTTLLDFSLSNRLHDDLYNDSLTNDLWTHLSGATFGFLVPGTRTYFTFGYSGGHASGVCYKCTQDNGNLCGGYCPPIAADRDQYYWLWDLEDLIDVKNGNIAPHEVFPYDYGPWNLPFQVDLKKIGGGSFDPINNQLYLSLQMADTDQGTYSRPPLILVFSTPPTSNSIQPDICLWMEGAYDNANGIMPSTLLQKGLLPANHPYNVPPWDYFGTEGQGWTTADYPATAVDWVKVSFRTTPLASSEVAATVAVIQEDGCLFFPNSEVLSDGMGSSFYIFVEHRNHIGILSSVAVDVSNGMLSYDFRISDSYSGSLGAGQKELAPGIWGMFAGDGDQLADPSGFDINGTDHAFWEPFNGLFDNYIPADFNMDGDITGADKILWNINNGIFSAVEK